MTATTTTTRRTRKKRAAPVKALPADIRARLWPIIREHAYAGNPCPSVVRTYAGAVYVWSEKRDGRLLKELVAVHGEANVAAMIQGVRLLVDRGAISWAKPRTPFTLLVLNRTWSGVTTVAEQGLAAFGKQGERPAPKRSSEAKPAAPQSLADILTKVMP